jgi:hypothetical protein
VSSKPYLNPQGRPSDLGNHLRQVFNLGEAPITQTPGAAHPTTRKFYDNHQGYDYGTPSGTAIRPARSGKVVQSYTDNSGFGNRALVQLDNGESYFLSHLKNLAKVGSFNAGDAIALTGGIPGTWGAGNTTGAHLDITPATGNAFSNMIKGMQSGVQRKVNLKDIFSQARQKYGKGIVAVGSQAKIAEYAKNKPNAKIIRL